jgi:hypothetical protein
MGNTSTHEHMREVISKKHEWHRGELLPGTIYKVVKITNGTFPAGTLRSRISGDYHDYILTISSVDCTYDVYLEPNIKRKCADIVNIVTPDYDSISYDNIADCNELDINAI